MSTPTAPVTHVPLAQLARDNFFHCGVLYEDSLSSQLRTRLELEEDVKIYLEENYERINVPVPQFGGGDPADIIHDFQRVRSSLRQAKEGCPGAQHTDNTAQRPCLHTGHSLV